MYPVFIFMICMYTETFPESIIAPKTTMVVYGILVSGIHLVFISISWSNGTFYVSVTAPKTILVVYGILFGGMHPVFISIMCM